VLHTGSAAATDFLFSRSENPKNASRSFPSCSKSTKRNPSDNYYIHEIFVLSSASKENSVDLLVGSCYNVISRKFLGYPYQPWASAEIFPGGAKSTFWLSFSGFWRCNPNGRTQNALPLLHHKENAQCYVNGCKLCSL